MRNLKSKTALTTKNCLAVATALWFAFSASDASAQSLVTDFTSTPGVAVPLPGTVNMTAAGEFTLTAGASITSAVLSLKINTDPLLLSDLSVEILGNTANAPNATVYATSFGDSGTLSSTRSPIGFGFTSTPLVAGTYWLELFNASTSGGVVGWTTVAASSTTVNTGTDGTVNDASLFNGNTVADAEIFSVQGTLTSTPEPTTLAVVSLGVCAMALFRRRN